MRFQVIDTLKNTISDNDIIMMKRDGKLNIDNNRYRAVMELDCYDTKTKKPLMEGDVVHIRGTLTGDDIDFIGVITFLEGCFVAENKNKEMAIPLWSETRDIEKLTSIYTDPTSAANFLKR